MKKFIFVLLLVFALCVSANAATWCKWSGTEATNCKSDNGKYIVDGHRISASAENLNPRGWFQLVVTEPNIGTDQIKDEVQWSKPANQILKTWTVRDMTADEVIDRDKSMMDYGDYLIWAAIKLFATDEQIATILDKKPELKTAYLAWRAWEAAQ